VAHPRNLPVVLSRDEVARLLLIRVERGKGGRYRNAMLPADLLTLLCGGGVGYFCNLNCLSCKS